MTEITSEIYMTVARRLRDEIAQDEWFNNAVEIDIASLHLRLLLTAIIYRRTEHLPEGMRRPISDVVPVWWECSTSDDAGPTINDFSFNELKPYLIDCD